MATAGWSTNSMGGASSKPAATPTTFGRNSNGMNRCLIVAVIVLLLLLILFGIAIGVLFATNVFILNTQRTNGTNASTNNRSSDAVGATTTLPSSPTTTIAATTTTLGTSSTTL
uniref:Uncharacterized protein n=1 Tax=Plectus sambesii TaxID=2011161 RepID=A0A914VC57_9BILA